MINQGYTDLLKIWLEYNILIGIQHFYIYDNAPYKSTKLMYDLQRYIEMGYVTVVPWYPEIWRGFIFHSDNWVKHQIWSENDCIQRYGYKHEWLGILDIDEFPIPLQLGVSLADILKKVPSKFCSLVMNNCFPMNNKMIPSSLLEDSSKLVNFFQKDIINRSSCHTRQKHFVRPSTIYYFRIHWLEGTIGCSNSYRANYTKELRVNHYKHSFPKVATKNNSTFPEELKM